MKKNISVAFMVISTIAAQVALAQNGKLFIPSASANNCSSFVLPGVDKIQLSEAQALQILSQQDSSGISKVLRSYNICVDEAALNSGYLSLDEVSANILRQLSYPTSYTGPELVLYVNYVVNMMLFSSKN